MNKNNEIEFKTEEKANHTNRKMTATIAARYVLDFELIDQIVSRDGTNYKKVKDLFLEVNANVGKQVAVWKGTMVSIFNVLRKELVDSDEKTNDGTSNVTISALLPLVVELQKTDKCKILEMKDQPGDNRSFTSLYQSIKDKISSEYQQVIADLKDGNFAAASKNIKLLLAHRDDSKLSQENYESVYKALKQTMLELVQYLRYGM